MLANLTAVDNVALPALIARTMPAEQAYAHAYDLLGRVGLADRADAYPGSMSGGEQQRVAIARALINSPALLLADEPTSDLDEDTEADIIDLLVDLQRKHAFGFVLVTHNLQLAKRAQRTYEMRQGAPSSSQRSENDASVPLRSIPHQRCRRRRRRPSGSAAICCVACRSFLSPARSFSPASSWPISTSVNTRRCACASARRASTK